MWHCSVRAAPGDRMLSDHEWAQVAYDIMHRTGLAPRRPGRRRGPLDRGPPCPGSHPRRCDAGSPGRNAAQLVERLLPRRGGVPGRRGTARAAADRAPRPYRGPPPDPGGVGEGAAPGRSEAPRITLRRAVSTAAAGTASEREFFARLDAARRQRPQAVQHPQPWRDHRVRGRAPRRHRADRRAGLVQRREARSGPYPAQAASPLGPARAGPREIHRRRARHDLGTRRAGAPPTPRPGTSAHRPGRSGRGRCRLGRRRHSACRRVGAWQPGASPGRRFVRPRRPAPYGGTPSHTGTGSSLRRAARLLAVAAPALDGLTYAQIALILRLAALIEAVADMRAAQCHAAQVSAARAAAAHLHAARCAYGVRPAPQHERSRSSRAHADFPFSIHDVVARASQTASATQGPATSSRASRGPVPPRPRGPTR